MKISPTTHLGPVNLLVKNLELERSFYQEVLGFEVMGKTKTSVVLGKNKQPLLTLEQRDLPYPSPHAAGLYHTAFLYTSAGELARTLTNVFNRALSLFQGASDHLVSQAFYLVDPENNGIELYLDRPRSEWKYVDGMIQMGSEPIDLPEFIKEHNKDKNAGEISVGHIHLKVGDIAQAKAFYVDELGFDVVAYLPSALFVSAGGYHHHIGLNTWDSEGAGMREPALGLEKFTIITEGEERMVTDPWGNEITITNK
jgi:catechol 2,3-dioxygenase